MQIPRTQALGRVVLVGIGIWALLHAISALPYIVAGFSSKSELSASWAWPQVASATLNAVVGAGLIALRSPLSATLFARDEEAGVAELSAQRLEELVVATLGLWLIADGLLSGIAIEAEMALAFDATYGLLDPDVSWGRMANTAQAWTRRLSYLPSVAIGLVLVLGAGRLSRFWQRARSAGRAR